MTPREWDCFQCGSRFATDSRGELVEYAFTAIRCRGCRRLLAILQASAAWHATLPPMPDPAPGVLSRADILARLRPKANRPEFDYAKAAANDRDEE